ncbi:hypothetical protein FYJ61_02840 [Lactobacillus equicursoris]|uniref:Uncharacterized protein n=1 Tax=Lactobacillus equicursoris TaxID=420645 RepID=A0A844FMC3_9LACO|nr:hypothetical protein [Lactobacillus equicursoris]MDD6387089.1 hypothetical protein [Lactobacillus equicursoris]MST79433.1 hypothetical protein [Lactobacillus equicursoris]
MKKTKKLSKKQISYIILAVYGILIIILGRFNSRMQPYYALTVIAVLLIAVIEMALSLIFKKKVKEARTYRTVAQAALLVAIVTLIAVMTTAI